MAFSCGFNQGERYRSPKESGRGEVVASEGNTRSNIISSGKKRERKLSTLLSSFQDTRGRRCKASTPRAGGMVEVGGGGNVMCYVDWGDSV